MRALRLGLDAAFVLLLVLVLALVIALRVIPALTGWVPLSILTGSMSPSLPPGSLIMIHKGAMPQTGDVATYLTSTTPVTHRVTGTQPDLSGWGTEYLFKGDANLTNDPKAVPSDAVLGVLAVSVPAFGYPAFLVSQPIGVFLIVSIGLLLLTLRSLLSPRKGKPPMQRDMTFEEAKAELTDPTPKTMLWAANYDPNGEEGEWDGITGFVEPDELVGDHGPFVLTAGEHEPPMRTAAVILATTMADDVSSQAQPVA